MIDGRHTGTGGGNHVVVGGATPLDSPFLRRPDLLKSLVLHWQRHPRCPICSPACSSARPARRRASTRRATTASTSWRSRWRRCRSPADGAAPLPWLVDRLFRNLLDRRHRQHPSRRNLHRQALFARRADRPARPGRVPRLRDAARRAHEPRPAAADPRDHRAAVARPARRAARRAGARRCTTGSCCRISSGRISSTCSPISRRTASRSAPTGSRRSSNSAFRSAARSSTRASSSNCARRWSRGMCWARRARSAARRATSILRPSGCR